MNIKSCLLLLLIWMSAAPVRAETPVVLVTIDTLRADYLPMGGNSKVSTPQLERLAASGIVFEQALTSTPLTLPAHVSLMTGTYPQFHGVRDNSGYRLPDDIPTLAQALDRKGYATAAFVGSAVLDRSFGLDRGFDFYGDQFDSQSVQRGVAAERTAQAVLDQALAWLPQQSSRFFLWVHLYDPHSPYQAPGSFGNKGYIGEIEYVDSQLARLFEHLRERKLWDSSLIMVTSDHGEDLFQHGEPTHGFFVYQTALHVPMILKLPRNELAGTRVSAPVRLIDVDPTIRQILRLPASPLAQGTGMLGLALGKEQPVQEAYAETLYPHLHFGWSSLFSLRAGRYKLIEAPQPELYDLQEDPGETRNLFQERSAVANQLRQQLQRVRLRFSSDRPAQPVDLDPELRQRLQSLGYATITADAAAAPSSLTEGADPKSKIDVYSEIYQGMEEYTLGRHQSALNHFDKAIRQDPEVPLAHDYRGSASLALGQIEEAVQAYRKALELAPGRAETASNLAFAYLSWGRFQEAEAGFELVTHLAPQDWQAWQLLGVSRVQLNKPAEAVEAFQQALERNPVSHQVLFNLATVYQQLGQHLRAIELFRRLVEVAPSDAEAWSGLAASYQESGLGEQAEEAYLKAIELQPQWAAAYFNYANFFARKRDLKKAEEYYRKAIETDSEFALAHRNLAAVLELQGRNAEAQSHLKIFEKLSAAQP